MEMVKEMTRMILLTLAASSILSAGDFSLTIGSPVAAGVATKVKGSVFAVRLEQCEDLGKSKITGSAEGIAGGIRKSVPIQVLSTGAPNVYVVPATWGEEGTWVVSLQATCANAKAGAIVPLSRNGFLRESMRLFPRFAAPSEVEASLKALTSGAK